MLQSHQFQLDFYLESFLEMIVAMHLSGVLTFVGVYMPARIAKCQSYKWRYSYDLSCHC